MTYLAAVAAEILDRADDLLSPGPTTAQYRWCAIAINYTDLEVEKVAATIGIDPSTDHEHDQHRRRCVDRRARWLATREGIS